MLSPNDLKITHENPKIINLTNEIKELKAKLLFPNNFKGMVIGSGLGFMLGNATGAIAGGVAGFLLGQNRELTETDKQIIRNQIKVKENELRSLIRKNNSINKDVVTASELADNDFECYDFDDVYLDLFGRPSKPFHCMISGIPKSGKSIFSFKFADYLSQYGNTMYIVCEEGFSQTVDQKIKDLGISNRVKFSNKKTFEDIRAILQQMKPEFVVIDSIDFAKISVEQLEVLKSENPLTSFITIHQATKQGQFRGSQEYAHNCDIICMVENGVIYQKGRFNAQSSLRIFG